MKLPTPIPTIELSRETGTITNALDLAAWLRRNSPAWVRIEELARKNQMSRIERLELLSLTLGLAQAEREAITKAFHSVEPDPFATPLDEGFEICDATFVPPQSPFDRMLRIHQDAVAKAAIPGPVPDYHLTHLVAHQAMLAAMNPEALPETVKPKDPADLAPAIFIGIGLFFAIAAGVLWMTGYGLAAALCGVTSILSLVRASKYPA